MKVPMRLCLACRTMSEKKDLLRVVRTPDGNVCIDPHHNMNGRGAYICKNELCVSTAEKRHVFGRALGVQIPEALYSDMRKIINEQK